MVYKYALEHLPKDSCEDIFKAYTIHEKKYGDRTGIEDVITSKRKFQYEAVSTGSLFFSLTIERGFSRN